MSQGNKELCLALLRADSESEVIELLKQHGYWDKPDLWRHYGDIENNWTLRKTSPLTA